ncbi:MAG: glycosyltransferase [Holophagales bacterium]|nr:glycosyltransferase [Holophagales bacterium]
MHSLSPEHFFFDAAWYSAHYPDVAPEVAAGLWKDPLEHYLHRGMAEGRNPNPVFEERWYLETNADAASAVARGDLRSGAEHFLRFGRAAGRTPSPFFDAAWYLAANPQAAESVERGEHGDGYEHFLRQGLGLGLTASPDFDAAAYLRLNPWAGPLIRDSGLSGTFEHLLRRGALDLVRWPADRGQVDPASLGSTSLRLGQRACRHLLRGSVGEPSGRLRFPAPRDPAVSVVLVARDPYGLVIPALVALQLQLTPDTELILVDDGCSPPIHQLWERVEGARILRYPRPRGTALAANRAAARARGELLIFTSSETVLEPGTVAAARARFSATGEDLGVVGARLVRPDGALHASGMSFDPEGNPRRLGQGMSPFAPEFCRPREVPYCSSAFLATRAELFGRFSGFDDLFAPAFFEDADYCFRLGEAGLRTVVEPEAVAFYHGPEGAGRSAAAADREFVREQRFDRNRLLFLDRHRGEVERLAIRGAPGGYAAAGAGRRPPRPRLLFVDDRCPEPRMGSGFPRSLQILRCLDALGWEVTFQPTVPEEPPGAFAGGSLPERVERRFASGPMDAAELLAERPGYYDVLWVSRPHNMAQLHRACRGRPELLRGCRLVYDAEAIFSLREDRKPGADARPLGARQRAIRDEVRLAALADVVVGVTAAECAHFAHEGIPVEIVGHLPDVESPATAGFDERQDLLFVGAVHEEGSPNHDGLAWFLERVWPRARAADPGLGLTIAGYWAPGVPRPAADSRDADAGVVWLGAVDDLRPVYDRSRVFVAPVRYGAGIPLKILEAAAHGLPVCTTEAMGELLGWPEGESLVAAPADDPELFARRLLRLYRDPESWQLVREAAAARLKVDADPETFRKAIDRAVRGAAPTPIPARPASATPASQAARGPEREKVDGAELRQPERAPEALGEAR